MKRYLLVLLNILINSGLYSQDSCESHKDSGYSALINENYEKAIYHYMIALNDTSISATVNFNLGIAYQMVADYENAVICYKNALELYTSVKKKAAVYNSLGILYGNVGKNNISINFFEKAILLNNKPLYIANLSNAFLANNRIDSAYYYFCRGNLNQNTETIFNNTVFFAWNLYENNQDESYNLIRKLKPLDNYKYLDRYYYLLGCYYQSANEHNKAKKHLKQALRYCNNKLVRVSILGELKQYQEAIAIIDTLLNGSENYSTKLNLAAKQARFYDALILEALQRQEYDTAFYLTEKSKAVALKAHLTDKGIIEHAKVKSVDEIQETMRKNEVILEYKIIDSLLLCFEITPTTFKHYTTNLEPYFFTAIYDVNEVCSEVDFPIPKPLQRYCDGAHYLFNIFLGDKDIKDKSLVVVPDGRFFNLAFDVLLTAPGDTNDYKFMYMPYLIRQNSIRYLYSASMNATIEYNKLKILHIAPPVELAGAEALKEAIGRYSRFYDGFKTKDELKSEMQCYNFLHFDTHGYLEENNPLNASLELGFDSLFVYEIIKEDFTNADMVFLAACNTGVGKYSEGEGTVSIERGFMLAGVKTVITAFWFASDLHAPRILSAYYRELKKGACPEEAMRDAKLEFLNSPPKVNRLGYHPYNWATYSIVGATGTVQNGNKKPAIAIAGLSTVLLISLLILLNRKRFK